MEQSQLVVGMRADETHVVAESDTAQAVGSGSLPVLATPVLLGWLEAVSCRAIAVGLGSGRSSVGTRVVLEHLAASPVGASLVCSATVAYVDGRLLRFEVVASRAEGSVVAHGEVTRVVVDDARFLARATG